VFSRQLQNTCRRSQSVSSLERLQAFWCEHLQNTSMRSDIRTPTFCNQNTSILHSEHITFYICNRTPGRVLNLFHLGVLFSVLRCSTKFTVYRLATIQNVTDRRQTDRRTEHRTISATVLPSTVG